MKKTRDFHSCVFVFNRLCLVAEWRGLAYRDKTMSQARNVAFPLLPRIALYRFVQPSWPGVRC